MSSIRQTAVAGMFYPNDPELLAASVDRHLEHGARRLATGDDILTSARPKAIVAPHAGYSYSGPIAGTAFASLRVPAPETHAPAPPLTRAIIIGPSHRIAFQGISIPTADAFATPLGNVPLDRASLDDLLDLPCVRAFDPAHTDEHSIEVELPFLLAVADPSLQIVPLVVGNASIEQTAEVLDRLWGGPETLVIISSDLSHFLSYPVASELDAETAELILSLDADQLTAERACGYQALRGLLALARTRQLHPALLDLRNSGDTAGTHDRVVGYCAFAFRR